MFCKLNSLPPDKIWQSYILLYHLQILLYYISDSFIYILYYMSIVHIGKVLDFELMFLFTLMSSLKYFYNYFLLLLSLISSITYNIIIIILRRLPSWSWSQTPHTWAWVSWPGRGCRSRRRWSLPSSPPSAGWTLCSSWAARRSSWTSVLTENDWLKQLRQAPRPSK